jgi:hypothetical protein
VRRLGWEWGFAPQGGLDGPQRGVTKTSVTPSESAGSADFGGLWGLFPTETRERNENSVVGCMGANLKCEDGETNPPNPHNPPPNQTDLVPIALAGRLNDSPAGRTRYSSQYHAATVPGAEMRDIGVEARRSRLRTSVGWWELDRGYEHALAAEDERDRRRAMRQAAATSKSIPNGSNTTPLAEAHP